MRSIEWWHFQWPWLTPNPIFKVMTFFEVEYQKNGASLYGLKDKVTIAPQEAIPNEWNGTTVCWPWLISRRVALVCPPQLSFFFCFYDLIDPIQRICSYLGTESPSSGIQGGLPREQFTKTDKTFWLTLIFKFIAILLFFHWLCDGAASAVDDISSVVISRPWSRDSSALEFFLPRSRSRSRSRDLMAKVSVLVSRPEVQGLGLLFYELRTYDGDET